MLNVLLKHQLRLVFVAVLALLFAQLGAVAHAYSHDATVQATSTQKPGAGNHENCSDCLAYAAVLSAAGTPAASLHVPTSQLGIAVSLAADSLHDDLLLLAFRSRAPPLQALIA